MSTPRTDAEREHASNIALWCDTGNSKWKDGPEVVRASFSRQLEEELDALKAENERLRSLIKHMWIHGGYRMSGYLQMTTDQKELYCTITETEHSVNMNMAMCRPI